MADIGKAPDWVKQAHALSDDVVSDDAELLAELAGVVASWPASNIVTRKALDAAALTLIDMAATASPEMAADGPQVP